ncbi:MAG: hypothetical protein KAI40_07565 [Desulfobacterales bacterium]|nr:hypothetical protein [Desulfobacterales bacterium]
MKKNLIITLICVLSLLFAASSVSAGSKHRKEGKAIFKAFVVPPFLPIPPLPQIIVNKSGGGSHNDGYYKYRKSNRRHYSSKRYNRRYRDHYTYRDRQRHNRNYRRY